MSSSPAAPGALDRARRKAYRRLIPLLFLCYVVAYVDRTNVSIAKLTMLQDSDLIGFTNDVIGTGAGIFFLGYFLLEIPGTLLVETWSARKWICRIMLTWGLVAAATAFVRTPWQFYLARFLLGLAEAGFFPGVIVYLTHWFPLRDRSRALSWFLIATPIAQMISPKICNLMLPIGTTEVVDGVTVVHPPLLGLDGWQWIYIAWGLPAVVLGLVVLLYLTDRPRHARWLTAEERDALEAELAREKALHRQQHGHLSVLGAFRHPRVLLLALAYFFVVTGNYGVEIFLPSILDKWYGRSYDVLTWALVLPPAGALVGQLFVGWSSDRTHERRWHTALPILCAAVALVLTTLRRGPGEPFWSFPTMLVLFTVVATGLKAYLPAFWALPSLFLTSTAAAGSIGLINSVGNLGGFVGPKVLGYVETATGSFIPGILYLSASMLGTVLIIVALGLGRRTAPPPATEPEPVLTPDAVIEPT